MDNSASCREDEDPDYSKVNQENRREHVTLSLQQHDARELAIRKIENVIRQQFAFEMHLKEREIEVIDQRINQARVMLDRLRACVLAKYYGTSEVERREACSKTTRGFQEGRISVRAIASTAVDEAQSLPLDSPKMVSSHRRNIKEDTAVTTSRPGEQLAQLATGRPKTVVTSEIRPTLQIASVSVTQVEPTSDIKLTMKTAGVTDKLSVCHNISETVDTQDSVMTPGVQIADPGALPGQSESRFYIKKRIIVGNTSKYISIEKREENDKSTHKWMVYVRGPPHEPNIDQFIKKVWFFLHPSYRPNDIVEVSKQPFHLTRRGWGEFPIRVQIHFLDPRNKRVDIIHELKLDKTYTGLQTLGAETVVDLELDRRTLPEVGVSLAPDLKPEYVHGTHIDESNQVLVRNEDVIDSRTHKENSLSKMKRKNDSLGLSSVDNTLNESRVIDSVSGVHPNVKRIKMEPLSVISALSSNVTTPASSRTSSRCASPEPEVKEEHFKRYSDEIEKCLRLSVKLHPLIDPARRLSLYPYCASTVQEFLKWNVGKQRACEIQRSLAMKRHILKVLPCGLSTKDVMIWCRRYGYTPCGQLPVSEDDIFCVVCGRLINIAKENSGSDLDCSKQADFIHDDCSEIDLSVKSLSHYSEFLSAVEGKEHVLPELPSKDTDSDTDVDVVEVAKSDKLTAGQTSGSNWLPLTVEQEWVRSAAGEIGVTFQAVNADGIHAHITEEMILSACRKFAGEIIRTASACAADQSSPFQSKVLVPLHIHKALVSVPHCDFLTESSLGILVEKEEQL